MKVKTIGWCVLLLFLLVGCQKKLKNSADLYSYVQNPSHGVLDTKERNGVKVAMAYIPSKLMVRDQEDSTKEQYLYFRLTYQIHDKDMLSSVVQNSYSALFNRLSFKLGEYLSVSSAGKEEEIADFQFSPMFGTTNNTEVVVVLDLDKLKDKKEFTFKLKDIGLGLPEYDFKFERKSIDRLEDLTQELKTQD